jgi:hypothetical protein
VKCKTVLAVNYTSRHGDEWGSGGIDPQFLISALDEWSTSGSNRFTLLKEAFIPIE